MDRPVDDLDLRLLELFSAEPDVGMLEASRRMGIARGTVQARLSKLAARGVVRSFGPQLDPSALGFVVTAFVTVEISQSGGHDTVAADLARIPEVLEAHTITGPGDMLLRLVARSNSDLQRVIDQVLGTDGIQRTASVIALDTQIPFRVLPLARRAASLHD